MKTLTHRVNVVLKPLSGSAGIELVIGKVEFGHRPTIAM